ncbi:MAG: hypothetical protein E7289_05010 [Lachnospiraceae bacterium]|nr:hypothetical protein [Lachnospiraceae bacterium]
MKKICMAEELARYNLDGKWNDYVGVQKEVLRVLRKEEFFTKEEIINRKTGISVKINAKGIKETLGTGKRFQMLPKTLKKYKIATIKSLKWIIENAELIKDDVENIHEKNGYNFAYFRGELVIDDSVLKVRITVKKKIGVNWFWIHNIDQKEKVPNYSTHP